MSATRRELVAEQLRQEIRDRILAPGSVLSETGIARRLGVSPTPVREAFHELLWDGWLQVRDGHRRVTILTTTESRDFFELISRLLALCLDKAADQPDPPPPDRNAEVVRRFVHNLQDGDYRAARYAQRDYVDAVGAVADDHLLARTVQDLAALSRAVDVHRIDATPDTWLIAMQHLVEPFERADFRTAARVMNEDRALFLADIDQRWAGLSSTSTAGHPEHDETHRPTMPDDVQDSEPDNITATVTRRLRSEILTGELSPGTPLRERSVARSRKVSATPVREAFWQLAAEALLEPRRGGGQQVSRPGPEDAAELLDFATGISALTVEWLIERFTGATGRSEIAEQFIRAADDWLHAPYRAAALERELTNRIARQVGNMGLIRLVRRSQLMATPAAVSLPPAAAARWSNSTRLVGQHLSTGRTDEAVLLLRTRAAGLRQDSAPR